MSNTYMPLYGVFDTTTGALQGVCPVSGVTSSVSGTPISVTGTPTVGSVLTAVLATGWTAAGYQWTRDGSNISGATSSTYTLVSADSGHVVGVNVSTLVYTPTGQTITAGATTSVGGITLESVGTGIYSGYILSDGITTSSVDIVSPTAPAASFFTTRAYGGNGARAPATGALAVMHDVDPNYTGWSDANRGAPITWDGMSGAAPMSVVSGDGGSVLRLLSGQESTAEQALLSTGVGGQVQRTSMVHTLGRMQWHAPAVIEVRARMPVGPAGQHPTIWALSATPGGNAAGATYNGNEYGFESNSGTGATATQNNYFDDHTNGVVTNFGTLTSNGATYRDGAFHTYTLVLTTTSVSYYVDGTLVRTQSATAGSTGSPTAHGDQPDYLLITNHAYNAAFGGESYSATAWTPANLPNGVALDVSWMRVWRSSTAQHFKPLASISDVNVVAGGAISITLPAATTLWGSSVTDYVQAIQNETEEPGGSATTGYAQLPSWLSYNSGTRTLSGTAPAQSGALHFCVAIGAGAGNEGSTCQPARFRLCVAPVFNGGSQSFTQGVAVNLDVYAMWDCGRLFQAGANPKGLTVSGLPAGLSFSSSTGLVTGTPTTTGSGTVSLSATNTVAQTTNASFTYTVAAASSAVPAPTVTGTLVASWDFNDSSKITLNGSSITAIAGSDGTSNALSNAGTLSTCPVLTSRSGKTVGDFTATSLQFLQLASNMGLQGTDITMVVVYEPKASSATHAVLDIGNSSGALPANRHSILLSTSSGVSFRTCDTSSNQSVAGVGSSIPTGIHCLIGRKTTGTNAAKFNYDGAGTAVVAGVTAAGPTGLNTTTLGNTKETPASTRYTNGYVSRVLVYSTALSDADVEAVAAWATTNYGTTNGV